MIKHIPFALLLGMLLFNHSNSFQFSTHSQNYISAFLNNKGASNEND